MMQHNIRIRLKAFDHRALDVSAKEVISTVKRTGATVVAPYSRPGHSENLELDRMARFSKSCLKTGPRKYGSVLDIIRPSPSTVDALMKLDLSAGVQLQIQTDADGVTQIHTCKSLRPRPRPHSVELNLSEREDLVRMGEHLHHRLARDPLMAAFIGRRDEQKPRRRTEMTMRSTETNRDE